MRYSLTEAAREDLLSIWLYTSEQWNDDQADRYIDALDMRFSWLTNNKPLWLSRPEIGEGIFSYTEQRHVIVFWELPGCIEILRVLHQRMDHKRHVQGNGD